MEKLIGTKVLRSQKFESANDFLGAKEFCVLFYGGRWDTKSCEIATKINTLLTTINQVDGDFSKAFIEVLYVSNDLNQEEYDLFMEAHLNFWCHALPWNDERVVELRKTYHLHSAPMVLVFDRNLECITREGSDDVLKMAPLSCRNYWVELLMDQKKIYRKGIDENRGSDDD